MGSKWPLVKLGEYCCKIGSGATPKGGSSVYLDAGDVCLIRSQNIYNDGFEEGGLVYIDEVAAAKLRNVIVEHNDILLNITGDSVARVCLVPDAYLPARVNQHVAIIRPNKEHFDARFLRYFLASPKTQILLLNLSSAGATRNALTKSMIENFEVPKPSLSVQVFIANILQILDDKIMKNRQINKTLEQMAQTLFKSWFVDFDPVVDNALDAGFFEQDLGFSEELLHRVEVRKAVRKSDNFKPLSEDIRRLFPDAFEECAEATLGLGGWVPEGWEINCLENISKCIKGTSYKSSELSASDTALVTLKSFQRGGGYRLDGLKSYVGSYKKEQEVFAGDLIIACTDVTQAADIIGKPAIVISDPCYSKLVVSLDVAVIRPKHISLKYYLYGIAKTLEFQNYTYSHSTGTTVLHLSKNAVPNFMVSLPNELILQRYHEMVLPLFDSIEKNTCSLRVLTKLRDTLLPKLISGELSLSDIKTDIPEETLI